MFPPIFPTVTNEAIKPKISFIISKGGFNQEIKILPQQNVQVTVFNKTIQNVQFLPARVVEAI